MKYKLLIKPMEWQEGQMEGPAAQFRTDAELLGVEDLSDFHETFAEKASRTILLTCSDAGIREAIAYHIPVLALRNPVYDSRNGRQSLFGAPVLLEDSTQIDSHVLELAYCRAMGLPMVVGETSRCQIRELSETDISVLFQLTGGKINEGGLYSRNLPQADYYDFWKSYIKNQYGFYGYGLWLITAADKIIGLAGFSNADYPFLPEQTDQRTELSYWIVPDRRGRGYAYEVCDYLVHYAGEAYGMETLFLFIQKGNAPSIRLAEKLGFSIQETYCQCGEGIVVYGRNLAQESNLEQT